MFGKIIVGGVLVIVLIVLGIGVLFGLIMEIVLNKFEYVYFYGNESSENNFLWVDINGVIMGMFFDFVFDLFGFLGLMGIMYGYEIKEIFMEVVKDDSIKGVLLYVLMLGGIVFGFMVIFDGIEVYQK